MKRNLWVSQFCVLAPKKTQEKKKKSGFKYNKYISGLLNNNDIPKTLGVYI